MIRIDEEDHVCRPKLITGEKTWMRRMSCCLTLTVKTSEDYRFFFRFGERVAFEGYFFYLWINRCKNNLYFRRSSFSRSRHIETFQWFDQCKARSFKARHHTSDDFVTSAAFATVDAWKWTETTSTIRQRFDFGSEQRHGYCIGDVVFAIFTSWTKNHSQWEKKWLSSSSTQGKE